MIIEKIICLHDCKSVYNYQKLKYSCCITQISLLCVLLMWYVKNQRRFSTFFLTKGEGIVMLMIFFVKNIILLCIFLHANVFFELGGTSYFPWKSISIIGGFCLMPDFFLCRIQISYATADLSCCFVIHVLCFIP